MLWKKERLITRDERTKETKLRKTFGLPLFKQERLWRECFQLCLTRHNLVSVYDAVDMPKEVTW